ncbi:MAG: tetratricopeptide repeat protein [Candidatus Omnitrophica bacterium]|nr:tetratricopeptide repeat protein [Candidatus Omnitrophota bacterium]
MKITRTTHILFIALIIVIVFSNSLKNKFAWDDKFLIVNNPYIKDCTYISKIFNNQLYEGDGMHSNFYRPAQLFSFMIDYRIWKLNPFGYHLTSLLLHIFNSALVYLIVFAISSSPYMAFVTASLFGVAPAISGITFYIPARSDLLMALFLFLSLWFFIRYRQKGKSMLYAASVFLFALSLICKEMALMLPLLLVLEMRRNHERDRASFKLLLPYAAVLLAYVFLRVTVLNFAKGSNPIIDSSFPATLPLAARLLTNFKVIFLYMKILVAPFGLHIEWFVEPVRSIFQSKILLYIAGFITMILAVKKISNKNKLILFGSLWFLFALSPVLNIYPISVLFGEGWLYVPSVGFFIVLSAIFKDIIKPKLGNFLSGILITFFLIYCAFFTIAYGRAWKDSVSVFNNVLRYEKNSPFIYLTYNNLGMAYYDKGDFEKSIEYCKKSISLNPDYFDAYNNLGIAYIATGKTVRAIKSFKIAIRLKRDFVSSYSNLGHLYAFIGFKDRAIEILNAAIKINPNSHRAYCNLGYVYMEKRDIVKAEEFFKKASQLREGDYEPHYCLGTVYIKNKNYKKALDEYNKALKLGLCDFEIYNKLGFAYVKNGRFQEAEAAFRHSLALNKEQSEPYNNLGNLYSIFGYFCLAINEYREALKIGTGDKGIVDNINKAKFRWKQALRKTSSKFTIPMH